MKMKRILAAILSLLMLSLVMEPMWLVSAVSTGDCLSETQRRLLEEEPLSILIAEQPESVVGAIGDTVQLTVQAARAGSTYQWQSGSGTIWSNSKLTGYNTNCLTVPVTDARYKYLWRCVVTDPAGNKEESAAVAIVKPLTLPGQPVSAEVSVGSTARFSVTASGSGLTYQWQESRDGSVWVNSDFPGSDAASFSLTATSDRYEIFRRCEITDAAGQKLFTEPVQILQPAVFAIKTQPVNVKAEVGETVVFSVEAEGSGLTYQWQSCGQNSTTWSNSSMTGSKTASISIPVIAARYGYLWRCVIKDKFGAKLTTNSVMILKYVDFTIKSQPVSVQAPVGDTVTFKVSAEGNGLTYQWQNSSKGGPWTNSSLTGSKTAAITIPVIAARYDYDWRCVITDVENNQLATDPVQIQKPIPLAIKSQPVSLKAEVGETAVFTVSAVGNGLTYQWQNSQNGTTWSNSNLTGGKTASISIPVIAARYNYDWRCVITDAQKNQVTTVPVKIVKPIPLAIKVQPVSVKAVTGETAVFTVTAEGEGLTYQWQNSPDGTNWTNTNLTGGKTASISIPVIAARYNYDWRCVITDEKNEQRITNTVLILKPVDFAIKSQPVSVKAEVGTNAKLTVSAEGNRLRYQWQYSRNGGAWTNSDLPGSTSAAFNVTVEPSLYENRWRCVITDAENSRLTTDVVRITKPVELAILTQPENVRAASGETIHFTVEAQGDQLTYQWQNSKNGGAWANSSLTGSKTAAITIPVTAARYEYDWRCVITDSEKNKLYTNPVKILPPAPPTEFTASHADLSEGVLTMDENTLLGTSFTLRIDCNKAWTVAVDDTQGSGWFLTNTDHGAVGSTALTLTVVKLPEPGATYSGRLIFTADGETASEITVQLTRPAVTEPTISVSSAEGKKGDQVTVDVSVANNPGVVSMSLRISYDASALRLVGVSDTGVMPGEMHSGKYTSPYSLTWDNDTSRTNFTAEGVFASLTFEILSEEAGKRVIGVSVPRDGILDCEGGEVNFDLQNGVCTVKAGN